MTDKRVHELKVRDFHLDWELMITFPLDGRTVLVECSDGIKRRAHWDVPSTSVVVEGLPHRAIEPLRWQDLQH